MKRLAILVAIGFAAAATAQTSPPPASWLKDVLLEGAVNPAAEGTHNCLSGYPERERVAHVEGITSLLYRIAEDGSVTAVNVRKSSGNAALDAAAVACVKNWRYQPATLEQKPIAIDWRNDVKWAVEAHPELNFPAPPLSLPHVAPPPGSTPPVNPIMIQGSAPTSPPPVKGPTGSIGHPHVCLTEYPAEAVIEHAQGTATVGYIITAEGRVENQHIIVSSGYATLDDAAFYCVNSWRYQPATKDNQPIAVPWKTEVKWLLY